MSKSIVYAANTATQDVPVNGTINFGNIVRRYGCNTNISNGNGLINGTGYYKINTNFTITDTAAGDVTITLFEDGTAIQGATATITAAVGSLYNINIPAVVRKFGNCNNNVASTITAAVTGTAATVNNATITIEKE